MRRDRRPHPADAAHRGRRGPPRRGRRCHDPRGARRPRRAPPCTRRADPLERRHRPLRQRLPRRRGRAHPRGPRDVGQGRRHRDPAPRDGGRLVPAMVSRGRAQPARSRRRHPARRAAASDAEARRDDVREARRPEPHGLDQGPRREVDDRGGRGVGRARAGPGAARAHVGEHRHLARARCVPKGLPAHMRDAGERDGGAQAAPPPVRRGRRLLTGRGRLERRRQARARDGRRRSEVVRPVPVRERRESARPLRRNRHRDRDRPRPRRRAGRRPRHGRDADGRRRAPP